MDETLRRREKQIKYNEDNGLSPQQIVKSIESIMGQTKVADSKLAEQHAYVESNKVSIAADPVVQYMNKEELKNSSPKHVNQWSVPRRILTLLKRPG